MCEGFWEEAELSDNDSLQLGPPLQERIFYKPLKQTSVVFLKGVGNRKEVIFFSLPKQFCILLSNRYPIFRSIVNLELCFLGGCSGCLKKKDAQMINDQNIRKNKRLQLKIIKLEGIKPVL